MLESALDEALDALVGAEGASVHDLVHSFPESSELRRLVSLAGEAKLALEDAPSAAARAAHERLLMARASELAGSQVSFRPRRVPALRRFLLRPVAVVATAALLGGPVTVAFASDAQPGEPLYGTKLAVEKVQLLLERDPAGDVRLHLQFAQRRLSELSRLLDEGRTGPHVGQVLRNLERHQAAAGTGRAKPDATPPSGPPQVDSALQQHVDTLTDLAGRAGCDAADPSAGDPACQGLLNAIEKSQQAAGVHEEGPPGLENKPSTPPGQQEGTQAPPGDHTPGRPAGVPQPDATPRGGPPGGSAKP